MNAFALTTELTTDFVTLKVLDTVETPIWVFDIDRKRVHWANHAALEVWRAGCLDDLRARDMSQDMSQSVATRLAQYQADFRSHDARFNEQWTLYPEGRPVSLHVHYRGYVLPDGRMAMLCEGQAVHALSPESLRSVEALLHTPTLIALYDEQGRPLYRNPAARASARSPDETLDQRCVDQTDWPRLLRMLDREGEATLTMAVQTSQGQRWHEVSARHRLDAVTGEGAVLVSEVDVTPLKQSEARARYLAEHDLLTGLPNRTLAQERFRRLANEVRQAHAAANLQAAVILIDLDHFKDVNDSWGHAAGDNLLVQVAERLRSVVRANDMVARFGGDEFLILMCAPDVRSDMTEIHRRIRAALGRAFMLGGVQAHVSATIGVSIFPDHGNDFQTILQHADLAMYQGKASGRDALTFYRTGQVEEVRARTELVDELYRALVNEEFELFYQPRVGLHPGHVLGAEALVRWRHPQRGWVPPGEFIPVCEASGLMRDLGRKVFEMAARQQAVWFAQGRKLQISVNLSPCEFKDPSLLADLQDTLQRTGCPPHTLELEITESMLVKNDQDDESPMHTLQALRALGLSIALDDFGTGYSNLAYLQRFPFTTLKIDRSFVQAPVHERPLAEAIVGMCRALGLRPVAEGVETKSQHEWLLSLGVTEFQGYLFAKPLPVPEFEALVDRMDAGAPRESEWSDRVAGAMSQLGVLGSPIQRVH